MTPAAIPPSIKAIVDEAAGKPHSDAGPVMICLGKALAEDRRLVADEIVNASPATIWANDAELADFPDRDLAWWMNALGHPKAHAGCCATCGCATTCTARAFYEAVVMTAARTDRGEA